MIPLRLRLRNFLSYRDAVDPLDFTSFTVACLTGENGHGKSSLLDAITWTLWGSARAGMDDLMHHGASEMEVEFEFDLSGDRYRVIRKRNRRGNSATSALEFQVQRPGEDRYVALTGDNIRETEKLINRTLRLTYDTFVNTSFLMQGKADLFTMMAPAGRKQVLADILALEEYEQLSERAREKQRAFANEAKVIESKLTEINTELDRRPEIEAALSAAEDDHERLDNIYKLRQAEIDLAKERLKALDAVLDRISRIDETLATDRRRRNDRQNQRDRFQKRLTAFDDVLSRRESIEAGMLRLGEVTDLVQTLTAASTRLNQLNAQRQPLVQGIERERRAIDVQRAKLAQRQELLVADAANVASSQSTLRELETQHATVLEQMKTLSQQRDRLTSVGERLAEIGAQRKDLKRQMDDIVEIMKQVAGLAECWICHQSLTPAKHVHLKDRYQQEGKTLGDRFRALAAEQTKLKTEQDELKAAVESTDSRLQRENTRLTASIARMRKQYDDALKASDELAAIQPELAAIDNKLAANAFAEEKQEQLKTIDAAIAAIEFDPAALTAARNEQSKLESFREPHQQLQIALAGVSDLRRDIGDADRDLADLTTRIEAAELERASLAETAQDGPALKREVQNAQEVLNEAIAERDRAGLRVGRARQQLDHCDRLADRKVQLQADLVVVQKDQSIHDDLAKAFGKNGVQAMIIDAAIPEIETSANDLLDRMSDGSMTVTLHTQRQNRTGGTSETLDIQIQSDQGTRAYELFSGGEAFRINFAIRIALAKLLAHRAGARLETLVIDEGFGTQDANGRDRIVEAIKAIEPDFSKILVITHIDELKDIFPVQIQVTKTPAEGSRYLISHR